MPFKVGVTTGLYTVSRAEELSNTVRKLGFALTRGANAIEIPGDVPHEITETEGEELMYIAKKQGLELLFHGSLTIPMCIPERGDWRDAHDHMQKSIRSAVHCGCTYVNFHASLNIWLELMTYAGRKLTMAFCDHEGNFISKILKENEKLREWFVKERGDLYLRDILTRDEITKMNNRIRIETEKWEKEELARRLQEQKIPDEVIERVIMTRSVPLLRDPEMQNKVANILEEVRRMEVVKSSEIQEKIIEETLKEKLKAGGKWDSEELRAVVGIIDGYHIMAHYMFYTKDPIWVAMVDMYKDVLKKYNLDYSDPYWVDKAWKKAEEENDKKFKEFFYGTVAAKYLEGHLKKILEWLEGDYIKKELKGKPKLQQNARKLQITIESPDARDPGHAGMHLLWSTRQLYAAIKVIRKTLKTDRVWLLLDFEHVATQGVDPIKDMEEVIKIAPDIGEYTLAVHANAPNPLHAHEPLELGDIRIYKLLYYLRITGFGKKRTVYLIYERGGAKDPYARSVEVLRLAAKYLEQDVKPEDLPLEYFGIKGPVAGGLQRQLQIIREHAFEPLKDLLEMPEEEWGMLSSTALKKGRKPEVWKKGELR